MSAERLSTNGGEQIINDKISKSSVAPILLLDRLDRSVRAPRPGGPAYSVHRHRWTL